MTRCFRAARGAALSLVVLAGLAPEVQLLLQADPPIEAQDAVVVDEATATLLKGTLKYLAANQLPSGAWSVGEGDRNQKQLAMTGYALMAFMATGNLPGEGEYGRVVSDGVQFLVNSAQADGLFVQHNDGQYMYSHAIATIALAEMYGQTKATNIRPKLEKLVRLIIACQNNEGGWRYQPHVGDADISVTVLQVVALRAAKNAGMDVPQSTIDKAVNYVRACFNEKKGGFSYQPNQEPGFARTAAAIYSLQVCGQYEDPRVKKGSDFLFQHFQDREWFTYGQFYAAPAHYMIGGEAWQKWYEQIKTLLVKNVHQQGDTSFWTPGTDNAQGDQGTIYCTAIYTMILAMPYHYIPLYQR